MNKNKSTILITGSSSGIGNELCHHFLKKENNCVIGVSRRLTPDLDQYSNYINLNYDLSDLSSIESIINFIKEDTNNSLPKVDTLIYMAGFNITKPITEYNINEINNLYNVNTISMILLSKEIIAQHDFVNRLNIIYASSIWASCSAPFRAIYGSTKSSINSFLRHLTSEFVDKPFYANCLDLGWVDTPLSRKTENDPIIRAKQNRIDPENRYIQMDEVLRTIESLRELTAFRGASINIDNGFSIL
tara:strand:+ start:1061 stop:1798 length:738 start_codon:yes stop_codon:yes gene_type:complete